MTDIGRRDRHRSEIEAAVAAGQQDRAEVLAREHLVDFPQDARLVAELLVAGGIPEVAE